MLNRLAQVIGALGRPRIFVIGDLMVDRYLWGSVNRVSPEAPVQILKVGREESRAGGAANVAANLASLGASVTCAGVVGRDVAGDRLAKLLRSIGVRADFARDPGRPTSVKTRMIAHNQQMLRVDHEETRTIGPAVERALFASIDRAAKSCDLALVSDYSKGTLTARVCARLVRAFRARRRPVLVGLKSKDHGKYRGATGAALNRSELSLLTGDERVEPAAGKLLRELGLKQLVVTLGEQGLMGLDGARRFRLPAAARQVYDVTGAGDTVISALAVGLASGLDLESSALIANAAAGIVVGKVGTATVTRQELLDHAAGGIGAAHRKRVDLKGLAVAVARERARRRKVVFTNGCFDLLHPGHLRVLEFAKSRGDVLVVGLNTDRSVRRLKGPGRPVQSEEDRAALLGALECVDYVVLFDEPTPEKLLRRLRPDVLVKGGDYTPDKVVGHEFVSSYGGRIEVAPLVPGLSTTHLVKRMKR